MGHVAVLVSFGMIGTEKTSQFCPVAVRASGSQEEVPASLV